MTYKITIDTVSTVFTDENYTGQIDADEIARELNDEKKPFAKIGNMIVRKKDVKNVIIEEVTNGTCKKK